MSNSAWHVEGSSNCKRAQLAKHSGLRLNSNLLSEHEAHWSEEAIVNRASKLFDEAKAIWPEPKKLLVTGDD
jgi:hypothetical protein